MEHYKLVFSSNNRVIEISSHDKAWVEKKEAEYKKEIVSLLSHINITTEKAEGKSINKDSQKININPSISINEFYRKYVHDTKISSRPDVVTYFVYYLTKIKKVDEISALDVKNCFKEAGYPSWNKININDVLNQAKKKAFLNSHNNQWTLTITGEDFVINNLSEIDG